MSDIKGVKIVEENAGFKNSLILTYTDASGQLKGVVVAWSVDDHVGETINIPDGLIPADATNVQFGLIPNGGKAGANPSDVIQDIATAGSGDTPTVFDIAGKSVASGGAMKQVTFDGHDIQGAAGADLMLQSEAKNPERDASHAYNDANDYVLGDESGSDDSPDKEVTPSTPHVAGERDMNDHPLASEQLGFEDLFNKSDGDFNDLIIEVIHDETPPAAEQTASSSTILQTGQDLTVQMTGPDAVSGTPFDISGLLSLTEVNGGEVNFAIIVDVSGSTSSSAPGTTVTVGDVNQDGVNNTYLDYELAGVLAVQNEIASVTGNYDFNLGYIDFDSSARAPFQFDVNDDLIQTLIDAGQQPLSGGGTNFESPLHQAINYFNTVDPEHDGQNFVLFISDGQASTFSISDELATLEDDSGINATIKAVGFGTGASVSALDVVDSDDSAIIIEDPGELPDQLPGLTSPVNPDDIASLQVLVNGVVEDTIAPADLTVIPGVGLSLDATSIDTAVTGDGLADLIQLTVNTTEGETLTTGFYVGEIGAADQYVLSSPQAPVDFIQRFNANEGDTLVLNFTHGALAMQASAGGDGDDFDVVDTGSADVLIKLVNAVGVTAVDDLFLV